MKSGILLAVLMLPLALAGRASARNKADPRNHANVAARATNALGLELLRTAFPPDSNAILSPYSIQVAAAMVFAGSEGKTRKEMAATLHYPNNESRVHNSFAALTKALQQVGPKNLTMVNRL